MTFYRTLIITALLLAGAAASQAWLRRSFTDAEIVSRAELMVVGHIKDGSLVRIPHGNGSSWEHHVELVIDEVLKGQCASNSMIVSIHYGLDPMVGEAGARTNARPDAVEVWDTGNSGRSGTPVSGDLRTNQIWLLRQEKNAANEDTDWIGIYDPEDIQPVSRKAELMKYLPTDPIDDLVVNLTADGGLWQFGGWETVSLPETTPSEQLVKQISIIHQITNYTILNMRTVFIPGRMPYGFTNAFPAFTNAYMAALIRTGPAEEIILFSFGGPYPKPGFGWWHRMFDRVKAPALTPGGVAVENPLKNFEAITNGMTRAEVEERLRPDGGLRRVSPVGFIDHACPGYKMNVEFDCHYDAAHNAISASDDKVIRVSIPCHQEPFYD